MLCVIHHGVRVALPFKLLGELHAKEIEFFCRFHDGPVDEDAWFLLKSTMSSFVLLTLRERWFSWHHSQSAYLLPVGPLVVVGNQAFYCHFISELDDELELCEAMQFWEYRE